MIAAKDKQLDHRVRHPDERGLPGLKRLLPNILRKRTLSSPGKVPCPHGATASPHHLAQQDVREPPPLFFISATDRTIARALLFLVGISTAVELIPRETSTAAMPLPGPVILLGLILATSALWRERWVRDLTTERYRTLLHSARLFIAWGGPAILLALVILNSQGSIPKILIAAALLGLNWYAHKVGSRSPQRQEPGENNKNHVMTGGLGGASSEAKRESLGKLRAPPSGFVTPRGLPSTKWPRKRQPQRNRAEGVSSKARQTTSDQRSASQPPELTIHPLHVLVLCFPSLGARLASWGTLSWTTTNDSWGTYYASVLLLLTALCIDLELTQRGAETPPRPARDIPCP